MASTVTHIGTQIANNTALSGEIDIGECKMLAIEFPSTWPAGITTISFQSKSTQQDTEGVNPPQEVWRNLYDDAGNEITLTVGANRIVGVSTAVKLESVRACRYIRIRTGTSSAPVNVSPLQQLRIIAKSD